MSKFFLLVFVFLTLGVSRYSQAQAQGQAQGLGKTPSESQPKKFAKGSSEDVWLDEMQRDGVVPIPHMAKMVGADQTPGNQAREEQVSRILYNQRANFIYCWEKNAQAQNAPEYIAAYYFKVSKSGQFQNVDYDVIRSSYAKNFRDKISECITEALSKVKAPASDRALAFRIVFY